MSEASHLIDQAGSPAQTAEHHLSLRQVVGAWMTAAALGVVGNGILNRGQDQPVIGENPSTLNASHDLASPVVSASAIETVTANQLSKFTAPPVSAEASPLVFSTDSEQLHAKSNEKPVITREAIDIIKKIKVPKAVRQDLARNSALISLGENNSSWCSGRVIRADEKTDSPVTGVETARHCLPYSYVTGTDGKNYMVVPSPITVSTGKKIKEVKTQAVIDRFVIPNVQDDISHDMAIGIAAGQDATKVYAASLRNTIKPEDLKPGDEAFMESWPAYEPDNFSGEWQRQLFPMKIYETNGTDTTPATWGEGVSKNSKHVVWTYMAADQQGAECSWGASGSVAVVVRKVKGVYKILKIGTLSFFDDISNSVPMYANMPPYNPTAKPLPYSGKVVAKCGFTTQPSPATEAGGGTLVHIVQSAEQIPGYISPDQAIEQAREEAKDPNYQKTLFNGLLAVSAPKAATGFIWYDKPMLFHFGINNATVIGVADPNDPDHLAFSYIKDADLPQITFAYAHQGSNDFGFETSSGADQYQADTSGDTSGDFVDTTGQIFGSVLNSANPMRQSTIFQLRYVNDQYTLAAAPTQGNG